MKFLPQSSSLQALLLAAVCFLTTTARSQPFNDSFSRNIRLLGNSGGVIEATTGATAELGEPNHAGQAGGASVWFRWRAVEPGLLTVLTYDSDYDTLLAVYTGPAVDALTPVASNDDASASNPRSIVRLRVVPGTTYHIAVDGKDGATGFLGLVWGFVPHPANDNFADAENLPGTIGALRTSTLPATKEPGEPNHANDAGGHSVWYKWTAPAGGVITVNTLNSTPDTLVGVYTGSSVNALTRIDFSDDAFAGSLWSESIWTATAGQTYFIAVDGWHGEAGPIEVTWSQGVPENDDFDSAQVIVGTSGTLRDRNMLALPEDGEPVHAGVSDGFSVWYRWTAPVDGLFTFNTFGSSYDTVLAVYTGEDVTTLTMVAENDDANPSEGEPASQVFFNAEAGVTYTIAVDGAAGEVGLIALNWGQTAPPNDLLADAEPLAGDSGTILGSCLFAGKEPGEPNHSGDPGGSSIWYTWTAGTDGVAVFDTIGSTADTLLAVYLDDGLGNLTEVRSNDDIDPGNYRNSRLAFPVEAGVPYTIAVDGWAGQQGQIKLNWNIEVPPTLTIVPDGDSVIVDWVGSVYRLEGGQVLCNGPAETDALLDDYAPFGQAKPTDPIGSKRPVRLPLADASKVFLRLLFP